jgi:hypothetical protein
MQADLWTLIGRVSGFRVEIAGPGDPAEPPMRGAGAITVERPDPLSCIWRERGSWSSGPMPGTRFWNASRWSRLPGSGELLLAHLRHGPRRPVPLVSFRPDGGRSCVAAQPHLCGPDRYFAALDWDPDGVTIQWRIQTPTGEQRLTVRAFGAEP